MTSPLTVVVHDSEVTPGLSGLCAGYELGTWRSSALAEYLFESLPEFCLTYSDLEALDSSNAVELLRKAASSVYHTQKFQRRGEFGELLLHVTLKQLVTSIPAVSKLYYKDSANDTVKGFDAVHVVPKSDGLELWLGEVKFYKSIDKALADSTKELASHVESVYLRKEFVAIQNKIDDAWPFAERLKALLHRHVSLDSVFSSITFAVLLTYDGSTTAQFVEHSEEYLDSLEKEFRKLHMKFSGLTSKMKLRIHLILVPLSTKADLQKKLEEKLRAWQKI